MNSCKFFLYYFYYLREKGYTQAEIAARLGYKTHSAVTKRLTAMRKQFDEFSAMLESSVEHINADG